MRKHKGIIITATILLAAIAVVAGNRFVKNQDNNEKNSRETEKVDVAEKKVEVKKETSLQKEATEISETTEITEAAVNTEKKNGQKIQDAHEAIRPTDLNRMPIAIKEQLPRDLFRLYQLIWKRFVASRMSAAQYDTTSVKIQAKDQIFTLAASKMRFDGFMSVYTQEEDKDEENVLGGNLDENSVLEFINFDPKQHFTQPPAHYTEASLVRALEELGIGRPSTYAPTITTILARRYITKT